MTRGLAVALAAGFVAGSVGAQSFAPLPAYAAQAMGAPDSRAGWAEAPPLLSGTSSSSSSAPSTAAAPAPSTPKATTPTTHHHGG
jgi:hypothetical protein